jgi:hypothetical protein
MLTILKRQSVYKTEENISNIVKGKNPWVEGSGRLITPAI